MSTNRAYERMRAESRNEFQPKSIIFSPAIKANDKFTEIDWLGSFTLRAKAVYVAITEKEVTAQTIPKAQKLLIDIAKSYLKVVDPKAPAEAESSIDQAATDVVVGKAPGETTEEALRDKLREYADAIYLVLVFLPGLKKTIRDSKYIREAAVKSYESTGSQEMIKDIVKYENQLPLSTIISVLGCVAAAIKKTKEVYSLSKDPLAESIDENKLSFSKDLYELLHPFCWYYSPFFSPSFFSSKLSNPSPKFKSEILKKSNLLECLHYSIMPDTATDEEVGGKVCRIPASANRLRRSGIRFLPEEEGSLRIKFKEPSLRIPALVCDFKLETVVRNLIAWEKLNLEGQKPVTRYFQLMNDLVQDVHDVWVMRKAGVLRGGAAKGRGFEELALMKMVDGNACYPSVYVAVDREVDKAKKFYDKRMKSFLVRNRPAVVWVSSVAAASVIATAIYASRRKGAN